MEAAIAAADIFSPRYGGGGAQWRYEKSGPKGQIPRARKAAKTTQPAKRVDKRALVLSVGSRGRAQGHPPSGMR